MDPENYQPVQYKTKKKQASSSTSVSSFESTISSFYPPRKHIKSIMYPNFTRLNANAVHKETGILRCHMEIYIHHLSRNINRLEWTELCCNIHHWIFNLILNVEHNLCGDKNLILSRDFSSIRTFMLTLITWRIMSHIWFIMEQNNKTKIKLFPLTCM